MRFSAAHFISFLGKCERLAEYICKRIMENLRPRAGNLAAVTVGVEETPGQTAYYRRSFTAEVPPQIT